MDVFGAFSGMGGLELGFAKQGHRTLAMAEIDVHAKAVLAQRFPGVPNLGDVAGLQVIPSCDVMTAGFPCQDVSQAGLMAGIGGARSGLVRHTFDALRRTRRRPEWLVFENVPFLLSLKGGVGMAWLVEQVESLGYAWAYRVVDAHSFGLPQRRQRLVLLASRTKDPATVLFTEDFARPKPMRTDATSCGFYWTEGRSGIGWAVDAIPPLRAMSTMGILSMPAIWRPGYGDIVVPSIEDAERLQGFEPGWSSASSSEYRGERFRWKLVGNAVSVRMSEWIAGCLTGDPSAPPAGTRAMPGDKWTRAAYGRDGERFGVDASDWVADVTPIGIDKVLAHGPRGLSDRALRGFASRLAAGNLRVPDNFKQCVRELSSSVSMKRNGVGLTPALSDLLPSA